MKWISYGVRRRALIFSGSLLAACAAIAAKDSPDRFIDPHYTRAGYFDMHVCHWPDRPLFFTALFSTTRSDDLGSIDVFRADGKRLGALDLSYSEPVLGADGTARAFKAHFEVERDAPNGWYYAQVTLKDGRKFTARDYVSVQAMPWVELKTQLHNGELASNDVISWTQLPQPAFYRVVVIDLIQNKKMIYKSDLLTESHFRLPPGIVKSDGLYMLRVHARNRTREAKWGDFNHGSMTAEIPLAGAGS